MLCLGGFFGQCRVIETDQWSKAKQPFNDTISGKLKSKAKQPFNDTISGKLKREIK